MTKPLFSLFTALLAAISLVAFASGQSLPVCTVSYDNTSAVCTGGNWSTKIQTCKHATVTCPNYNVADLGITFGYAIPSTIKGTIVFFSPEGGTKPWGAASCPQSPCYSDAKYFDDYLADDFQVMQTAWDSNWEDTGTDSHNNPYPRYIGFAAARAAAFLKWIYEPTSMNGSGIYTGGGMCTQGNSGGGGAVAYNLAWYGGYSYIDHAIFLSSPPLSDIETGCAQYSTGNTEVTVCPQGQLGCNPSNNPQSWTVTPYYGDALTDMRIWADADSQTVNECRPGGTTITSTAANEQWKDMSIVDDGTVSTFSYPQTSMSAYLCSSVYSSDGNHDGTMNNSSSQAQLFYGNFTSTSQYLTLVINGVGSCNGVEDVTNAVPKQLTAIEQDMVGKCVKNH